jgi:hypothetical protein
VQVCGPGMCEVPRRSMEMKGDGVDLPSVQTSQRGVMLFWENEKSGHGRDDGEEGSWILVPRWG